MFRLRFVVRAIVIFVVTVVGVGTLVSVITLLSMARK